MSNEHDFDQEENFPLHPILIDKNPYSLALFNKKKKSIVESFINNCYRLGKKTSMKNNRFSFNQNRNKT